MLTKYAIIVYVINANSEEVDGAMEDMNKNLTEQQKKDAETFAQLPEDAIRDMEIYMAGMLAAYSRMNQGEKMAG